MNCSQCGQEIPQGLNFCIFCGTPVDRPETPQDTSGNNNPINDNQGNNPADDTPAPEAHAHYNGQSQWQPQPPQPEPAQSVPGQPGYPPPPYNPQAQMPYGMPQQNYGPAQPYPAQAPKKKSWIAVLVISIVVLVIFGGIGGWYYYENVYLPELRDREAPRAYAITDIVMRNTRMSGVEYNRVGSIPYSAELIIYENDGQWAHAKYKPTAPGAEPIEGYVASQYLIDREDMLLLNSIYADNNARMAVNTSKCKRALLNFYKANNLVGNIDRSVPGAESLPLPDSSNHWVLEVNDPSRKPAEIAYPRMHNSGSKFTDFAAVLTNPETGARHYVYFYFDDDETPHLLQDGPATGRYIAGVARDPYDYNRLIMYFID